MKKLIYFLAIVSLFAFTSIKFDQTKATAIVNQYQGIYVYTDAKPQGEHEYLGTVKAKGAAWGSGQYTDIRDRFIKTAKKDYPSAEGIILYLQDGGIDRADVIKFK
jgi:hypothetical protein